MHADDCLKSIEKKL
jgi:hypothetical protein